MRKRLLAGLGVAAAVISAAGITGVVLQSQHNDERPPASQTASNSGGAGNRHNLRGDFEYVEHVDTYEQCAEHGAIAVSEGFPLGSVLNGADDVADYNCRESDGGYDLLLQPELP